MKWILIASILPILSLLTPGIPGTHDGTDHVVRIANFYKALSEGIIVPRWAGNLNWGYGHPVLMFLYPLPEYAASMFHSLGFSFIDSTKLVFGAAYILSGVTMYFWMRHVFGIRAGVVGSLLYLFAPYRFVDLYVRGALGEHVAFIFPPLILYFLHTKKYIWTSFAIAALILAHNAIALMFIPVIALYGIYILKFETNNKIQRIIRFVLTALLGFGLSAFFWIPALFEGKFTLRYIVTAGEALTRFVAWPSFVFSPWNYAGTDGLPKSLGFIQIVGIFVALVLLKLSKDKKIKVILGGSLVLLLVTLFIMTRESAFIWKVSPILQNFQFPWRFLALSVFLTALIGGISLSKITLQNRLAFIVICILSIIITVHMWRPKSYEMRYDSYYSSVYPGTTDTGESSPIWSVRFMEKSPKANMEVIDGEAYIQEVDRSTTVHEYVVSVNKPTLILENTLYFPGWVIYLNGTPTQIEWQNPNYRGLMTFWMQPGDNQRVRVVFEDTKVRKIANTISLISLAALIWLVKR